MSSYTPTASLPAHGAPGRARAIIVTVVTLIVLTAATASFTLSLAHLRQIRFPQPRISISHGANVTIPVNQAYTFTVKPLVGSHLKYTWSFGDGSATVTTSATTVAHTYASTGAYTVAVTTRDSLDQTASSAARVTVLPPPPVAAFTVTTTSDFGEVCAQFDASTSTGAQLSYSWDYGDGNTSSPSQDPQAGECYYQAGTFVVTLTVTDSASQSASISQPLTIGG